MVDVIVLGGGHNGLVASILLAKRGLKVTLLEQKDLVGGAAKTEYPFPKAPKLGSSTGAYLLGLMPPELMELLGLKLNLFRRDPHYFLPTSGEKYLLFGSDEAALERQFRAFFSEADWRAHLAMNTELAGMRDDLAPAWLKSPLSLEETAEQFLRPALRRAFVDLCRGTVRAYLDRFGFRSDLIKAMYAVTDGFSGLNAGFDTPGAGHNLLLHNMCRLPGSGGTWMIAEGGMGAVTQKLAALAQQAGVEVRTGAQVAHIVSDGGVVRGVALQTGEELSAKAVISNADPFRTAALCDEKLPDAYQRKLAEWRKKTGTTMKVNLALERMPTFRCLPKLPPKFAPTIHLLPQGDDVLAQLEKGYAETQAGKLSDFPSIEWYVHTTLDPSLQDPEGRHNSALFVQWVPYALTGTTWEKEEARYVKQLLSICDQFAPGTSDLVVDTFTLTPPKIEAHFGITGGHIHHVDNAFSFDQRVPYALPLEGLFQCSAGCHPGGSVVGASGHNAAQVVLQALGL